MQFFYPTGYDALEHHNNMQFSTYDKNNDELNYEICDAYSGGDGGNWNQACHYQNLNGEYGADGDPGWEYMFWYNFDTNDSFMSLKSMRWMVREVV